VLKLYGAQPVAGLAYLHGKKGRAMVQIGMVDAPVTIEDINQGLLECVQLKQKELHVLAWEWEMGLNDLMADEAKKLGVVLHLLQIPREVMEQEAANTGEVRFFELAHVEALVSQPRKLSAKIALTDFVIANTELIPPEVRTRIRKWADYVDYWAVDWDFRGDSFTQGWVTYRTRKDRSLELASDVHVYDKPGPYKVLVKVVDIFGNDTTRSYDLSAT
jgi:adenine-specific DNA-methyltransferase